jgi:integrase
MARTINRLSAAQVAKIDKPGRYGDGGGLWLQVSQWGTKAWLFRYMIKGRARQMGLGDIATFSLKEARERARAARQLVADGVDPVEQRKARKEAAQAADAKRLSFREASERYIRAHSPGWRNAKHAEQWTSTLATYAWPVLGDLGVDRIETAHVTQVLEPIWTDKTETATRLRGRIERVLDWSKARGFRKGENPARWRGHLDKLLPARSKVAKVRHHPAMPYDEVPAFMGRLRGAEGLSARALEFTILTAARTGEAIGARWSEVDFATKVWTVPENRMKAGRPHRIPLSEPVLALLAALPRASDGEDFIFPGARKGASLSNMAMLETLRGMEGERGLTVHGFRSSFRDWAAERSNFPREIAEAALAHVLKDKTEAAYQRGDLLEKRRRLMGAWASFCMERPGERGVVIPMAERA